MIEKKCFDITNWHLDTSKKINTDKINKLCNQCIKTLININNEGYEDLVQALKAGGLQLYELELFLSKIDYYLLKINCEALEMGCHIIEIKDEKLTDENLRKTMRQLYFRVINNVNSKMLHILLNTKYRKIVKGSSVDLREINSIKQLRYLKNYAEICFYVNRAKTIFFQERANIFLGGHNLTSKNTIEDLKQVSERLHEICDIREIYSRNICKLLRKNTSYEILNPYKLESYYEILHVIRVMN